MFLGAFCAFSNAIHNDFELSIRASYNKMWDGRRTRLDWGFIGNRLRDMGIARLGWLFSDCNGVGVGRRPELCKFQLKHIDCRFQGCYFFFIGAGMCSMGNIRLRQILYKLPGRLFLEGQCILCVTILDSCLHKR